MELRALVVLIGFVAQPLACASPPPPPSESPLWVNGVRQKALTPKEAEEILRTGAPRYEVCYRTEQMNLTPKISDFVFRIWIPADGTDADVEMVKETVPGQEALRTCLETELERIKFPKHNGEPVTILVPLQGPK